MNSVSYDTFLKAVNDGIIKVADRWSLYGTAAKLALELNPQSCLELGPGKIAILEGSDIMDKAEETSFGKPVNETGELFLHDAETAPWPFKDKEYDLFISLQVFEHLNGNQPVAFAEAKRIAKNIIVSLPYRWDLPENISSYPSHHMIDENTVVEWTKGILPPPDRCVLLPKAGDLVSLGEKMFFIWENI